MKPSYYNENDPVAAQWLRNLIRGGHIAPGDVDERSIEDVTPNELAGYVQCHFFAGIGIWSYALRAAGWPDDRPVWTGSCPCQPFSAAGKGEGFDDERHLWPAWYWHISQRRPERIYFEQVASAATDPWVDLVHADLEALGYAFGGVPFPSSGVGAPMLRDRFYGMADAQSERRREERSGSGRSTEWPDNGSESRGLDDTISAGLEGHGRHGDDGHEPGRQRADQAGPVAAAGSAGRLADTARGGFGVLGNAAFPRSGGHIDGAHQGIATGPTNGLWGNPDWLLCRDGKWRPVRSGTFPLADVSAESVGRMLPRLLAMGIDPDAAARLLRKRGTTLAAASRNRTSRLKGYGNGIVAEQAAEFIRATMTI